MTGTDLKYEPGRKGKTVFKVTGDYYNRTLSGWEPLIEEWRYDHILHQEL